MTYVWETQNRPSRWSKANRVEWEKKWPLTLALLESWFMAMHEWTEYGDEKHRTYRR